jgi:thioredoxin-related protein/YHS domain-containing protein
VSPPARQDANRCESDLPDIATSAHAAVFAARVDVAAKFSATQSVQVVRGLRNVPCFASNSRTNRGFLSDTENGVKFFTPNGWGSSMSLQCLPRHISFVTLAVVMSLTQFVAGNEIPWSTDIESSLQRAASTGQPVLLEFTADWCVYCKRMEKTTFVDRRVVKFVNENYVAVRVDADEHKQLVADLDIKGLPAILVVSPTLQIIERIPGFQTPEALLTKLDKNSGANQRQVAQNPAAKEATEEQPMAEEATEEQPMAEEATEEQAMEEEATEQETEPEFVTVPERETFEPAANDTPEDEMTAEVDESTPAAEDDDFFATVSQKKISEPKTSPRRIVPGEVMDAPEFEGHCLVTAVESREIIDGSPRHQTKYRGHVLHFSSEEAKQTFLAKPNDYWPLFDGICSVAMLNDEERVMGKLEYAAFFRKRLWLFSTEESLKQFLEDPADVAEEMQELAEAKSAR